MKKKLIYHLWTLPRWFAAPFFGAALLLGVVLAGGSLASPTSWLAFLMGMCLMAAGHSANSWLDYDWTGLDKGKVEERSAEKSYTGGQNLLAKGEVSVREVFLNSAGWYVAGCVIALTISIQMGSPVLFFLALVGGAIVPAWYSWGKFNYTHELALGVGVGPLSVLLGMFAVNNSPDWVVGALVSAPFAIILCFAGLALDEWPDASSNLPKGVKSLAFRLYNTDIGVFPYMMVWILFMYMYQGFTIYMGWLKPMTYLTCLVFPFLTGATMLCHERGRGEGRYNKIPSGFDKYAKWVVIYGGIYPLLLFIGQVVG